jgi:hypothetical protein
VLKQPAVFIAQALVHASAPHVNPFDWHVVPEVTEPSHSSPELSTPLGQRETHVPDWHTFPELHAFKHEPQLLLSVFRFTSQPFAALPSQFAVPLLHTAQFPELQYCDVPQLVDVEE